MLGAGGCYSTRNPPHVLAPANRHTPENLNLNPEPRNPMPHVRNTQFLRMKPTYMTSGEGDAGLDESKAKTPRVLASKSPTSSDPAFRTLQNPEPPLGFRV